MLRLELDGLLGQPVGQAFVLVSLQGALHVAVQLLSPILPATAVQMQPLRQGLELITQVSFHGRQE